MRKRQDFLTLQGKHQIRGESLVHVGNLVSNLLLSHRSRAISHLEDMEVNIHLDSLFRHHLCMSATKGGFQIGLQAGSDFSLLLLRDSMGAASASTGTMSLSMCVIVLIVVLKIMLLSDPLIQAMRMTNMDVLLHLSFLDLLVSTMGN